MVAITVSDWKCSNCGEPSPGRRRSCDCATSSLYRASGNGLMHSVKIEPQPFPRPVGVSRVADNDQAVLVAFGRPPTDDELRTLHEFLKTAYAQDA